MNWLSRLFGKTPPTDTPPTPNEVIERKHIEAAREAWREAYERAQRRELLIREVAPLLQRMRRQQ